MKRRYLILVIIVIVEIAILSVVIIRNNSQDDNIIDVSSTSISSEKSNVNKKEETEKIRRNLEQIKEQMDERERELALKRAEILIKRKKLLAGESGNNSSNNSGFMEVQNIINNMPDSNKNTNNNNNKNNNTDENQAKDDSIKISRIINNEYEQIDYTEKIVDLGIPLINKYPNNTKAHITSRNVWDMQAYNNRIYIGSGDYGNNTGPVDVYYYDIEKEEFIKEGESLPDEQINRFVIIDNQLIITGTDPKENWDLGNYFIWEDNKWIQKRVLTGAIHNFDLVKFHGKLFAAIGNDSDSSIIMSSDGGNTFSYVYMYNKSGQKLNITSNTSSRYRVYDLIEFKDKLYAFCDNQLYEYKEEENIFMRVYEEEWYFFGYGLYGTAPGLSYMVPLKTKLVYDEKVVFINGSVKYTSDLDNFKTVKSDKTTYVYDALIINGVFHALCATPMQDEYIISIYKSTNLEEWEPVMYFKYKDFARSFEYMDGCFYFGIGTKLDHNEDGTNAGRILKIKI